MSIIWFVLAFAFSTSVSQDEPLDFSCATFHAFVSESELIARFGRENVTSGPVFGTDDGATEGTIVFANQPDTRVEITWRDAAATDVLTHSGLRRKYGHTSPISKVSKP